MWRDTCRRQQALAAQEGVVVDAVGRNPLAHAEEEPPHHVRHPPAGILADHLHAAEVRLGEEESAPLRERHHLHPLALVVREVLDLVRLEVQVAPRAEAADHIQVGAVPQQQVLAGFEMRGHAVLAGERRRSVRARDAEKRVHAAGQAPHCVSRLDTHGPAVVPPDAQEVRGRGRLGLLHRLVGKGDDGVARLDALVAGDGKARQLNAPGVSPPGIEGHVMHGAGPGGGEARQRGDDNGKRGGPHLPPAPVHRYP